MTMAAKYYLHGIQLPDGTWITQLTDTTPTPNINYLTEYSAGEVVPSFRGAQGAKPEITFTTPQIKTILDACGMIGASQAAGNVDLYYREAVNLGTRTAIAVAQHMRLRCVKAFLHWTRISAQQDQPATIACRLVPTFDGTTVPLVAISNAAIAAQGLASEQYTLGPVQLNAAAIGGVTGWDLELNPTLSEEASDGEDFLSWVGVERHDPVLSVTPRRLADWATAGLSGLALTAAVFYLRKRQPDLVRVYTDATAGHIKFSAVDNPCGMATIEQITGGAPQPAQGRLRCGFRISTAATAYPLTVDTASAIT